VIPFIGSGNAPKAAHAMFCRLFDHDRRRSVGSVSGPHGADLHAPTGSISSTSVVLDRA